MLLFKVKRYSFFAKCLLSFFLIATPLLACNIQTRIPGNWKKLRTPAECELAKTIIEWKELCDNASPAFNEVVSFFTKHPTWPNQLALRKKAEESIDDSTNASNVMAWLRKNTPLTAQGAVAFAKCANKNDALVVKKLWLTIDFSETELNNFFIPARKFLSADDLIARFDQLLKKERIEGAKEMLPLLPVSHKPLAEARLKMAKNLQFQKVNSKDPGYLWQYANYLRRNKKDGELFNLLKTNDVKSAEVLDPGIWWKERKVLARRFIETKRFKDAFDVVKGSKVEKGVEFAESKWMEGWLNLRFLKRPQEAYKNFDELYSKVEYAVSVSKAAYWAARAAEQFYDKSEMQKWLKKAAKHRATFYGQIASSMLQEDFPKEDYRVSKFEKKKFEANELVRAIRLLHKVGNVELTEQFFWKLALTIVAPDEHEALIELAAEIAGPHMAVEMTKLGAKKVMPLIDAAYPKLPTANLPPMSSEYGVNFPALVHAIIRQESAFQTTAKSHQGAKGLMQILEGTAKDISKSAKLPHGNLFDPKINVVLGEAIIRNLLVRYKGSLILAIAAYNAGPGNADKWVEQFGYPNDPNGYEAIEWIQMIPFYETRHYVETVLENYWRYCYSFDGVNIKKWHELFLKMDPGNIQSSKVGSQKGTKPVAKVQKKPVKQQKKK